VEQPLLRRRRVLFDGEAAASGRVRKVWLGIAGAQPGEHVSLARIALPPVSASSTESSRSHSAC